MSTAMSISPTKVLKVGWKHRYYDDDVYLQQKGSEGGIKTIKLQSNKTYHVEDIIKLATAEFKNPKAVEFLSQSSVRLGWFNGEHIPEFFNSRNQKVGIFAYFAINNFSSSKHLYLLSTHNENYLADTTTYEQYCAAEQENLSVNISSTPKINSININGANKNNNRVLQDCNTRNKVNLLDKYRENPQKDPSTLMENEIDNENIQIQLKNDVFENTPNKVRHLDEHQENLLQDSLELTENEDIQIQVNDVTFESTQNKVNPLDKFEKISQKQPLKPQENGPKLICEPEGGQMQLSDVASKKLKDYYNTAFISHWYTSQSRYSGEVFASESSKKDMYFKILNDSFDPESGVTEPLDENDFEPGQYGYIICKIYINGDSLFRSYIDDDQTFIYEFPKKPYNNLHCIIHDLDEVHGFYEGNLCIGVIPHCTKECQLNFQWFCNEQTFKEGPHLQVISYLPNIDKKSEFYCKILCKTTNYVMTSKKIVITKEQREKGKMKLNNILSLTKNDFTMDMKSPIGAGGQGKVYKGSFGEEKVAVKVVKLFSRNTTKLKSEIAVLKATSHKNFIKLCGVCMDIKQVYLVMEYFEGQNILEIMVDDELKTLFNFNLPRKRLICRQLCEAIASLHLLENPVIHRDIKPENIILNEQGLIKLCDFGLSKFQVAITELRSTIGSKSGIGTRMYMAPELILHNHKATMESDVWALACTVIEIFTEEPAWSIETVEELKTCLERGLHPDINKLPADLHTMIQGGLKYEANKRLTAAEMVYSFDDL